jgi:hypothetical protein
MLLLCCYTMKLNALAYCGAVLLLQCSQDADVLLWYAVVTGDEAFPILSCLFLA